MRRLNLSGGHILNVNRENPMSRTIVFFLLLFASIAWADDIADLSKTPGAIRPELTKEKICTTKWGKDERHVTAAMKKQVFELYGYSGYDDGEMK